MFLQIRLKIKLKKFTSVKYMRKNIFRALLCKKKIGATRSVQNNILAYLNQCVLIVCSRDGCSPTTVLSMSPVVLMDEI